MTHPGSLEGCEGVGTVVMWTQRHFLLSWLIAILGPDGPGGGPSACLLEHLPRLTNRLTHTHVHTHVHTQQVLTNTQECKHTCEHMCVCHAAHCICTECTCRPTRNTHAHRCTHTHVYTQHM